MDDLVKQAREALEGVTPGPWALDEGGEVHAGGSTVFAWPEWSDQSDHALHRNMEFGAASRDLMPAMADRIEAMKEAIQVAVMAIRVILDGDHAYEPWRAGKGLDPLDPAERVKLADTVQPSRNGEAPA